MNIKQKITVIIAMTMLTLFILTALTLSRVFLNSFLDLEKQEAVKNIRQAVNTINREVYSQSKINSDWAEWDDTHNFMKDKNEGYIASNFDSLTFTRLRLNYILFINTTGEVVYAGGYDLADGRPANLSDSLIDEVKKMYKTGLINSAGLATIDNKIVIMTTHQILKSDGTGPQRGLLVMIRYIDESQIEELSQITGLKMILEPMTSKLYAQLSTGQGKELKTEISEPINFTTVWGYGVIDNIYSQPVFLVKIEVLREIYLQGVRTIIYLVSVLVMCTITLSILLSLALDRIFIRRLLLLDKEIELAMKDKQSLARVYLPGNDELSGLAAKIDANINLLRQSLEDKQNIISNQGKIGAELKKSADELKVKTESLEKLNSMSVGRELRMVELKKRLEEFEKAKKAGAGDTK